MAVHHAMPEELLQLSVSVRYVSCQKVDSNYQYSKKGYELIAKTHAGNTFDQNQTLLSYMVSGHERIFEGWKSQIPGGAFLRPLLLAHHFSRECAVEEKNYVDMYGDVSPIGFFFSAAPFRSKNNSRRHGLTQHEIAQRQSLKQQHNMWIIHSLCRETQLSPRHRVTVLRIGRQVRGRYKRFRYAA